MTASGERVTGAPERAQDHVIWPRTDRDMATTRFVLLAIVCLKRKLIKFECPARAVILVDEGPRRHGVAVHISSRAMATFM